MTSSTYFWPGTVHFGFGTAKLVAEEAAARNAKSAFIVVDPGVMKAGLLDVVLDELYAAKMVFTIHDKVISNPDTEAVTTAAKAFREADADVIIGIGGGSALDTAKAVKLMVSGSPSATVWDYANRLGDVRRPYPPRHNMPPLIAIPTTAGTGSEVTPWAVITRPDDKMKFTIGDHTTIPDVALVDPALSLTLPSHLTAATGIDTLTHLIEAYVSSKNNPILDPMILFGISLVSRSLRTAVARGDHEQARSDMLQASLIGGIAISSKLVGACHALAHPLSGLGNIHHGLACALMLPHQMQYSLIGTLEKYADIAVALDDHWLTVDSVRERAQGSVTAVTELITDIGLPRTLTEVNITREMVPTLAKAACADNTWRTNPRTVAEKAFRDLYLTALGQKN